MKFKTGTPNHIPCFPRSPIRPIKIQTHHTTHRHVHKIRTFSKLYEVEDLKGIRLLPVSTTENPELEYLVQWKTKNGTDTSIHTWEPMLNLSPDLIRDFDEKWWNACNKMNKEVIFDLLKYGGNILSKVVDSNGRSALHYASAYGRQDICEVLLGCGSDANLADKDGYTPLHIASGYLHNHIVKLLLGKGESDPELTDDQGRTPLVLVEGLRDNLPVEDPSSVAKRIALEEVIGTLTNALYEILTPVSILDVRNVGGEKEYLVEWPDDVDDSWVKESDLAEDVKEDYENGFEYAEIDEILKRKSRGDERWYLVQWKDKDECTWEPEENIETLKIEDFEKKLEKKKETKMELEIND